MAEGPAPGGGGTIGRLNVEITGNSVPLQTSLKQAEAATKTTSTKMGASIGGIRGLFSKLFIPVAVFGSVSRLIDLLESARESQENYRKSLEETRKAFSDPINLSTYAMRAGVSEFDKMRAELLAKAKETREALDKLAEQQLMDKWRLLDQNLGGLFGTMSGDDIRKELLRQQNAMTKAVEDGLKNIADEMAKKMAEVLKAFLEKQQEQANKHLESIAIDSARSRQMWEAMQAAQPRGAY